MKIKVNNDILTVYDVVIEEIISPKYNDTTKEIDRVGEGWRLVVTLVGGRRKTLIETQDKARLVSITNKIWDSRKSRFIITKEDLNDGTKTEDANPEYSTECNKTGGAIR
jgi:hypothetical protein